MVFYVDFTVSEGVAMACQFAISIMHATAAWVFVLVSLSCTGSFYSIRNLCTVCVAPAVCMHAFHDVASELSVATGDAI